MCCHAELEDALIFVEIANSTSEMSPAFNLFLSGQYGTLALVRPRLLNRDQAFPPVTMTPRSVEWDWSRLGGNMGVGKSNFNINNFWWDLRQWSWDCTWIRRVDCGLGSAQGVFIVGFRIHTDNISEVILKGCKLTCCNVSQCGSQNCAFKRLWWLWNMYQKKH